ncbi:hypothetical protein BJX68DRAFT_271382 [Aspergillus pseudodeflectus]|uniref:BZIP domain-containing protein n=1 Tax=Aspergillus pseudodeflectus TaxID=176178 RepID=A0ABR4JMB6_9EURO
MVSSTRSSQALSSPLDPSLFTDYMSLVNGSFETLDVTSPQSTDADEDNLTPSQTPSPNSTKQGSKREPRKRGRPKMLDEDGGEVASKERRKVQVRQAQRAYRSRKEEQMAILSRKVSELEQKLLIVRGLYLSTHAAVMSTGLLVDYSANPSLKLLQDNLQLLLANTDVQVPPPTTTPMSMPFGNPHTDSLQFTPGVEPYPMLMGDMLLGQEMAPVIMPDKGYDMMF